MEDKDAIATTASNSNKLNHLLETLIRHDEAAGHRLQESQDQQQHHHHHHHRRHHHHQPQHRELLDLERPYREPSPAQFAMTGSGNPTAIVSGKRKASEAININANITNINGNNNNNNNGSSNNNNGLQRLPQHLQSEWSPGAVSCLLDTYADKFTRGKGFLRNSDWEDVASTLNARESSRVPKTVRQCRDKVDSLKKRYKMEKKKAADSGSSRISWPLFSKLDELLGYQSKVSRIPGGVDAGVKVPFAEPSIHHHQQQHHPRIPDGYRHEQHGLTLEEMYCMPRRKKGKMTMVEDTDAMSEEEDSESSSHQMRHDKHSSRTGSLDEGSHSRRGHEQAADSEKASRRQKVNSADPVQALADAIVGFSDVYAKIEMTKMEIYTKMKLEIAKLEMESSNSDTSSSSSSET